MKIISCQSRPIWCIDACVSIAMSASRQLPLKSSVDVGQMQCHSDCSRKVSARCFPPLGKAKTQCRAATSPSDFCSEWLPYSMPLCNRQFQAENPSYTSISFLKYTVHFHGTEQVVLLVYGKIVIILMRAAQNAKLTFDSGPIPNNNS